MFTLTIETDNAAFDPDPGPEFAAILRELAARLAPGVPSGEGAGPIRDANGNRVGAWALGEAPQLAGGFLVAVGNPADGFSYHGPFADEAAAVDWAEPRAESPWWVCPLSAPAVGA